MTFRAIGLAGLTLAVALPVAAQQSEYGAAIDAERLQGADSENESWLSYGRTYDEQRYSPLDQINRDTVSELGLSWYADMTTSRGQESTPVVVDGALYITTAWSLVHAFDVRGGERLWTYDPQVDRAKGRDACCDVVNRGVAAWDGKIFVGTLDGRLVALDSASGDVEWEVATVDASLPYTITGAPRVVKGKVLIGNGGAEYGVRGFVTAYDAETGEQAWRFYTVPGNPADGYESDVMTAAADTWTGAWWNLGGGGTVWDAMAYDPELDLLYIGVGNGSPWNQALRSPGGGDNLFLSSIVALDPDDGSYRWHYQTTPGETWDYTATQHIMLADLEIEGDIRRVVMQAPKNGFFYVLDAEDGGLISANNYTPVNWATHIDLQTGRPAEVADARYEKSNNPAIVLPGPLGGHNWYPMAFSQDTGLVYIPVTENFMGYVADGEFVTDPDGWNTGVDFGRGFQLVMSQPEIPSNASLLKAWNPVTQEEVWRVQHPIGEGNAGVLATAGGLVFQGTRSGEFVAYNDETGEALWTDYVQAGVMAAPATFTVDGEQHIALLVGSPALPKAGPGAAEPTTVASRNNSRLLIYRAGGDAMLPSNPITTSVEGDFEIPQIEASNELLSQGETAYNRNCSVCHGPMGISLRADTYPDLRLSRRIATQNSWAAVVLEGELSDAGMVSFDSELSDSDAEAIRTYIINQANLTLQ
ncbi:MAG: PQQ-dependent dehydrogenase, methanol/ethanol family [Gammaproteobacteria bacterium]|nr:PQQ-dependent dehydrogenase, methanol/ethanol family [Gammaproteobacteria bacterium]HBJ89790.1 PQQ-dependent dehydrogenase, methanol/ethanol family [Gammaproteobacteria bacterium]